MSGFWRKTVNLLIVVALAAGAVATATGCRKEGPAEKTGKAVDKAVEKAGDAVENATKGK